MNKTIRGLSIFTAIILLATSVAGAQDRREGWYGGLDLGLAMPHDMDTRGRDNDVPTNCDQHLPSIDIDTDSGPDDNFETLPLDLDDPRCARGQDTWENSFDLDNGPLLGLNVGYAWRSFRFEAEYFYRQHGGEYEGGQNIGPKTDEFIRSGERFSDIKGHQLFGNVYYDFHNTSSKLIPYIGGGVGFMFVEMDYSAEWHRNPDPSVIEGFGRHPAAAGTLTSEEEELSDTLWSYQLVAGIDYPITENALFGVKARYVELLSNFEDGDSWDSLRSHPSTVAPGGDEVRYKIRTDDLGFWAVSLNLKYFF